MSCPGCCHRLRGYLCCFHNATPGKTHVVSTPETDGQTYLGDKRPPGNDSEVITHPPPLLPKQISSPVDRRGSYRNTCFSPSSEDSDDDDEDDEDDDQDSVDGEKIFVAVHNYDARAHVDLSFRKGQRFHIVQETNADWWLARPEGDTQQQGFIPANYIAPALSLKAMPWFFGQMQREESEQLLMKKPEEQGRFLIRNARTLPNTYVLSVLKQDEVIHVKINRFDDGEFGFTKDATFPSVENLVEHHSAHDNQQIGLLTEPCEKESAPPISDLSVELMNTWHVPRSSIKMGNMIGRGNFGEVYEGRWNDTTDVAIKIVRTNSSFDTFMKEVKTMISFKHENVLQIYAVCKEKWPYWIVTELVPYGNMLQYLARFGHELSEVEKLYMAFGIASGMAYLSKKRCIHCDLAARNILMGQDKICKVADFGLSHKLKEEYYDATGHVVPYQWMAPEVLIQLKFTRKSDVWSFGVLLYELFTDGKHPYGEMDKQQVQDLINCGRRLEKPEGCPDVVYHIMLRCWNREHRERPSFSKLRGELLTMCLEDESLEGL
ncbi:tyrosine-protein kinase SRK3-like [Lethenteron reissneri]|uniref:tyrosine-protein kinase SRK3-like n=1 Tax=Lethenteron reissneri TaxID=7753 RepID=UPI002AB7137B|nr:tyrosine-protein kinase SRK3-like [Lethenteron reissneri]